MHISDALSQAIFYIEQDLNSLERPYSREITPDICWLLLRMEELKRYLNTEKETHHPRFVERFGKQSLAEKIEVSL